ncbi:hypothetical protein WJX77_009716 [Trebouxia sp. C0004]
MHKLATDIGILWHEKLRRGSGRHGRPQGLSHLVVGYSDVVADYASMLTSSQITDAPTEAARAMLQLLFLMVHSLADQVTTRQVFANKLNSHRTQGMGRPSAAASMPPMLKLEENITALRTYLTYA